MACTEAIKELKAHKKGVQFTLTTMKLSGGGRRLEIADCRLMFRETEAWLKIEGEVIEIAMKVMKQKEKVEIESRLMRNCRNCKAFLK